MPRRWKVVDELGATRRSGRWTLHPIVAIGLAVAILTATLGVASASAQTIRCGSEVATIIGTAGNDVIRGTSGRDVIVGGAGNDRIDGRGGRDVICGGPGHDRLVGGPGRDYLNGGPGRDRLVGKVGNDVLIGGSGQDILVGGRGRDRLRGGGGHDRCDVDVNAMCESVGNEAPNPTVDLVVHVSVDGLRADHVTEALTPNLHELIGRSASTLNARTDTDRTVTLPNHTSQFTGLPVHGGHEVDFNDDNGGTVHDEAGRYVPSVFDVVHDSGGGTAMIVGKSKFAMIDRSWDAEHGAPDTTGADDGRDKIDLYEQVEPDESVETAVDAIDRVDGLRFLFVHLRQPDAVGHDQGWGSAAYDRAVRDADQILGALLDALVENSAPGTRIAVIVTADHGGELGETGHGDVARAENYTVPFIVSAPGIAAGTDLYELNRGRRSDPGTDQPDARGVQPIRTHETANLALDLLGHGSVPGSVFNRHQDLRIG